MPVTSVHTDPEALTTTLVADFPVPVERLWGAFTDPRQLERFWGPPSYPATFSEFDLRPGGRARYDMTGPDGEVYRSVWLVIAVDAPTRLAFDDLFATEDGEVDAAQPPSTSVLDFEPTESGSRVRITTTFPTAEALETLLAMGMEQGFTEAFGQLDRVLADLREYALGTGVVAEVLDDTHVRFTRAFDAPRHAIWRAHTEPELKLRWLLGPDGWEMTVCENELVVGGRFRQAWAPVGDTAGAPFGFEGENTLVQPERRIVSTEAMTGAPYQPNTNDLQLAEVDGATLLTLLVTYPSVEQRDAILATGMTDGMEASYQRLEREVLATA